VSIAWCGATIYDWTFLKISSNTRLIARICSLSSVCTMFVIVLAPSGNISSQFVIDMEHQELIFSSPEKNSLLQSGQAPLSSVSFHLSGSRQWFIKYTLWNLFLKMQLLLPAHPLCAWDQSHTLPVRPSTIASRCPVHTPTLRMNV